MEYEKRGTGRYQDGDSLNSGRMAKVDRHLTFCGSGEEYVPVPDALEGSNDQIPRSMCWLLTQMRGQAESTTWTA